VPRSQKRVGKYDVGKTLGSGASCKVKIATDSETGRKVALKIMKPGVDSRVISLVNDEVNAIAKIGHHPGVV